MPAKDFLVQTFHVWKTDCSFLFFPQQRTHQHHKDKNKLKIIFVVVFLIKIFCQRKSEICLLFIRKVFHLGKTSISKLFLGLCPKQRTPPTHSLGRSPNKKKIWTPSLRRHLYQQCNDRCKHYCIRHLCRPHASHQRPYQNHNMCPQSQSSTFEAPQNLSW